jgi:hypothetical protein
MNCEDCGRPDYKCICPPEEYPARYREESEAIYDWDR